MKESTLFRVLIGAIVFALLASMVGCSDPTDINSWRENVQNTTHEMNTYLETGKSSMQVNKEFWQVLSEQNPVSKDCSPNVSWVGEISYATAFNTACNSASNEISCRIKSNAVPNSYWVAFSTINECTGKRVRWYSWFVVGEQLPYHIELM